MFANYKRLKGTDYCAFFIKNNVIHY